LKVGDFICKETNASSIEKTINKHYSKRNLVRKAKNETDKMHDITRG